MDPDPVQRPLRQPFDAVDVALLFRGQPGKQFGDFALIDPAHAVGEHGVTRRRLALHGVRDCQHLVGRFQGRRRRPCQIIHSEPRASARKPLTPCRAQHTPASFERVD